MDLDLAQLRALTATVTEGTFEAAARSLHVTPSAVSQRIKALESTVGRVLLQRTKPVVATESGEAILRLARHIDLLTADARLDLGDDSSRVAPVSIPIAVNGDSLATWILPALATLPTSICFDLHRDDQEHTTTLLRAGTVMAAITAEHAPIQGCTSTPLGSMRYRAMCTPGFAAAWFADGATPDALAVAPVVVFDRKDDLQYAYLRRQAPGTPHPPRHFIPSSADVVAGITHGLGWGMVPDRQSEALERAGALVELSPGSEVLVPLYWQQWQLQSVSLELVAAAIRDAATAQLR